jgi:ABC-2 type transport system ATP-binding protein
MILECENLSKSFGRKKAVDNISMTIKAGDILGVVGPNGAGKSTLLKLFTGLIWPTTGNVRICGHDVNYAHRQAMGHVGAVIEWPAFIPDLSARCNLDILSGGRGAEYEKKLAHIIEFVELKDRLHDRVGLFSTGMKQRLGIALALLPNSQFIILDEPTNGLDPAGIVEIRTIIKEYNRRFGTTILITSHLLTEIETVCSRLAVITDGKIVASGTMDELLSGENTVRVVADDFDQAVALLRRAKQEGSLPLLSVVCERPEILLRVSGECAAAVNYMLVTNGLKVSHLSQERKTLESFFMEATGHGQEHAERDLV